MLELGVAEQAEAGIIPAGVGCTKPDAALGPKVLRRLPERRYPGGLNGESAYLIKIAGLELRSHAGGVEGRSIKIWQWQAQEPKSSEGIPGMMQLDAPFGTKRASPRLVGLLALLFFFLLGETAPLSEGKHIKGKSNTSANVKESNEMANINIVCARRRDSCHLAYTTK